MSYDLIGRLVVASVAIGVAMFGAVCVAAYVLWSREAERVARAADEYTRRQRAAAMTDYPDDRDARWMH